MERTINSPICGNKITRVYYTGPFGIEEDLIYCPRCRFLYEFTYGAEREYVGNKLFHWGWSINQNSKVALLKKIHKAECMARRNWHRRHKISTYHEIF